VDGACNNQGVCTPNYTQACNTYGSQTCTSTCTWGACSCPQAPVCMPGNTQQGTCASCSHQVCDSCGQWGPCTTGATGGCDAGMIDGPACVGPGGSCSGGMPCCVGSCMPNFEAGGAFCP
jgi:hypothetical protein